MEKTKKDKFYCVGNAHLDPMWLWRWQEGSAEAKATIRSALDRMKEYPEFKFVCAASAVFKWIEEFDKEMFEEIKERVKEGRFTIVGGWFVQPDCNSPCGEGFARHGLYAQRYFKEKFGVTAHTGYNVDSFGHNVMIPQILKKQGMDNYIFMRPGPHEKDIPEELFYWISPDGSKVLASRTETYGRNIRNDEMTDKEIEKAITHDKTNKSRTFFYGVGNHGGGPTKQNIELILKARERHTDKEFIFSNLQDYFEDVKDKKEPIPEVHDDLQYHAIGCYSAHSTLKDNIRRAECELTAAESYGMMAATLCNKEYPNTKKFESAWENVLFSHFHESLGGCSIKMAHDDTLLMLGESRSMAMKEENNALQTISWKIDSRDANRGYPWVIFNPHSFEVKAIVSQRCRGKSTLHDRAGNIIPFQPVHMDSHLVEGKWNQTLAAEVTVPPMGYTCIYRKDPNPENPETPQFESSVKAEENILENKRYRITFEKHTGYIISLFDKEKELELIKGYAAEPVVIDETGYDTWAHFKTHFDREIGMFTDAKITAIENGPVRATLKVESFYGSSKLTQYFSLTADGDLQVKATVDWREKHKMLKLRFNTVFEDGKAYYEIPFGVMEREADGKEYPGLKWQAIKNDKGGLAIINNNKYSFSSCGGAMDLTVVRSPYYNDHSGKEDPEGIFMDQGEHEFSYGLIPVYEDGWSKVIKAAALLNQPVTMIVENNHEGTLPDTDSALNVSRDNIIISAFKRSEDNKGTVIRAYETDGKETEVTLSGKGIAASLKAKFNPYSVNTYMLIDGEKQWKEVLMTEFDI